MLNIFQRNPQAYRTERVQRNITPIINSNRHGAFRSFHNHVMILSYSWVQRQPIGHVASFTHTSTLKQFRRFTRRNSYVGSKTENRSSHLQNHIMPKPTINHQLPNHNNKVNSSLGKLQGLYIDQQKYKGRVAETQNTRQKLTKHSKSENLLNGTGEPETDDRQIPNNILHNSKKTRLNCITAS